MSTPPPKDASNLYTPEFLEEIKQASPPMGEAAADLSKKEPALTLLVEELADRFIAKIEAQKTISQSAHWLPISNAIRKVAFVSFMGGVYISERRHAKQQIEDIKRMLGDTK